MLLAEGIRISFDDLKVLKGICISVKEKENISIFSSSGAGKSTLEPTLGIFDRPDAGTMRNQIGQINIIVTHNLQQA